LGRTTTSAGLALCARNGRGISFLPLHRQAPKAALRDARLYELLALVDAVRGERTRERKLAIDELTRRLKDGHA